MSIRIETTIANEAAKHELVSALSSDTTPRCTCGEWSDSGPSVVRVLSNFHEHRALSILAALKAARIAVVELPEPRVQYDAEGDSPAEWETGVPDALVSAFSDPPEVFIDSDSMRPDQARGLAAALLAAADAAEASQ